MLLRLLGFIDFLMALMITLLSFGFPFFRFYFFVSVAHAVKALAFINDVLSLLDLIIVVYTFVLPFYHNDVLSFLFASFLFYKALLSLF